jgi:hypothetical protein
LRILIQCTEMEFLGISFTKDSSLLLHAIHSHFYWQVLKKTMLFSGFKNPFKKIRETRKLDFVEGTNEGRKPDKNLRLIRREFMPRNLNEKLPLKNSISVHALRF